MENIITRLLLAFVLIQITFVLPNMLGFEGTYHNGILAGIILLTVSRVIVSLFLTEKVVDESKTK